MIALAPAGRWQPAVRRHPGIPPRQIDSIAGSLAYASLLPPATLLISSVLRVVCPSASGRAAALAWCLLRVSTRPSSAPFSRLPRLVAEPRRFCQVAGRGPWLSGRDGYQPPRR